MCVMSSSGKVVVATNVLGFHYLKKSQPQKARQCPIIPPALFTCEMLAPSTGSSRERWVRWVPSIKGRPKLNYFLHILSVSDTMPSTGTKMKTGPGNDDPVSSESYHYHKGWQKLPSLHSKHRLSTPAQLEPARQGPMARAMENKNPK